MEKNVSLGTIQTRHSSHYAMNAIKKHIARKKSRSITDNTESIIIVPIFNIILTKL